MNERLVDFDLVEREAAQVIERREAGAEIIHHDMDAERVEAQAARRDGLGVVVKQQGFSDFQLETCDADRPDEANAPRMTLVKFRFLNWIGETLTATRKCWGHVAASRASRPQHPLAERPDQPGLFGQRHEFAGRDRAELRMEPAQQRLKEAHPRRSWR